MASSVKKVLSTEKAPQAIGPYSQGLLIDRTLYVSGQVGRDPASGKLVSGGPAEEFKQALVNVGEILKAGGCDFSNVVKTTVLLADINDFNLFNDVYKQFFQGSFPARAAYQVAALPLVNIIHCDIHMPHGFERVEGEIAGWLSSIPLLQKK